MDNDFKKLIILITYGVVLFLGLLHIDKILQFIPYIMSMFIPIFIGIMMAFVLNVPMKVIEGGLHKRTKLKAKTLRLLSLMLSIVVIFVIFFTAICFVIPEFISSIIKLIPLIQEKLPLIFENLDSIGIDVRALNEQINEIINSFMHFDWQYILGLIVDFADDIFGSLVGVATTTFNALVNFLMAMIISFYILIDKESINYRVKCILYAFVRKDIADYICKVGNMINDTYYDFFSGQCIEAIILGGLIFIALSIFRIPYASLTAILTGIFSFIPYIGAFLSCGVGVILVLLINPIQAIVCLVVYQIVQFVENQFIYPRVVGGSVGLSPLLTLIAVLVGGKLFGALGMIFFIPLTSVIYSLFKEEVTRHLNKKHVTFE